MRALLGTVAAVLASLAIPVALILFVALFSGPPEGGDGDIRGAIGILMVLPAFAVVLAIYYSLNLLLVRITNWSPIPITLAFSIIVSAGLSALFLASGAPLTWNRMGPFLAMTAIIWVLVAFGSAVQYWICFRNRQSAAV